MNSSARLGQSSFEFISIVGILFLIVMGSFGLIQSRTYTVIKERNDQLLEGVANVIMSEVNLASLARGDYYRTFILPESVGGYNYSITHFGSSDIILKIDEVEYIILLNENLTGNLVKGSNMIVKKDGIIYVGAGECDNGVDDDLDSYGDREDPGCYFSCNYLDANSFRPLSKELDSCVCGSVPGAACCSGLGIGAHYSKFDGSCGGGECLSGFCLAIPLFLVKSVVAQPVAYVLENGNVHLRGSLQQGVEPAETPADELIYKSAAGSNLAIINMNTGNMQILGSLKMNQGALDPGAASDDLIFKDRNGVVVAYLDDAGNFIINGELYQNDATVFP